MSSSRTLELCNTLRRSPLLLPILPLETALSLPVPLVRSGQAFLRFMAYKEGGHGNEPVKIYRPYIRVTVNWESGVLVEVNDLRITEGIPATAASDLLGEVMSGGEESFEERDAKLMEFYTLTDDLLPAIGKPGLSADRLAAVRRYRELLWNLIPEPLAQCYRELSPVLFAWLDACRP